VTRLVVDGRELDVKGLAQDLPRRWVGIQVGRAPGGRLVVHAASAGKLRALRSVCSRLRLGPAEVAACGDFGEDADILRWAGLGVAVAEGTVEVRAAADVVVPRRGLGALLGAWDPAVR
jgi:hydroxymethylpyrimidine pyrophosphatase-like HAD family hydrolase